MDAMLTLFIMASLAWGYGSLLQLSIPLIDELKAADMAMARVTGSGGLPPRPLSLYKQELLAWDCSLTTISGQCR